MKHHLQAERYCRDVLSGEVLAGQWIKLACKRHLSNLDQQSDPDYPYRFSPKAANRVCRFIELLPHVKDEWAKRRETIVLQPWQCFFVCCLMGWLRKQDGLRRFRQAYLFVARKNGKSLLAAALALYFLVADNEAGPEIVIGATTEDQSKWVFDPAKTMVQKTVALRQLGITVLADSLVVPATAGRLFKVKGSMLDGGSCSLGVADEVHSYTSPALLSAIVTGQAARSQPLLLCTTTAGFNTSSIGKQIQNDLQDVLQGSKIDEEMFGVIYTPDPDVDWKSDLALTQANPNRGISAREDYLKTNQRKAIQTPRLQVEFKTKNLSMWTSAATTWLPLERWNACYDPDMKLEDFEGEPCWVGLDLANRLDLTAYCKLFRREIEGKQHYYLFPRFYLPEARVDDISVSYYQQWRLAGWLEATPGSVNSHQEMREDIVADGKRFSLQVGHDPWGASMLISQLSEEGITCVEVGQTWKHMSAPMKELEALVIAGQFHHDGSPIMAWNVGNVKVRPDRNGNIVPDKESPDRKTDGCVATIIGLSRALLAPTESNMPSISFL
jgi:phage terminase large subunit-like protein